MLEFVTLRSEFCDTYFCVCDTHFRDLGGGENSGVPAASLERFPSAILGIDLFASFSDLLNAGALHDQLLNKIRSYLLKISMMRKTGMVTKNSLGT